MPKKKIRKAKEVIVENKTLTITQFEDLCHDEKYGLGLHKYTLCHNNVWYGANLVYEPYVSTEFYFDRVKEQCERYLKQVNLPLDSVEVILIDVEF